MSSTQVDDLGGQVEAGRVLVEVQAAVHPQELFDGDRSTRVVRRLPFGDRRRFGQREPALLDQVPIRVAMVDLVMEKPS
jgi:hypothetical protein